MASAIQQLDLQTCIPYEYLFITSSKRGYASGLNYHSHIHTHLDTQKDLKLASKTFSPYSVHLYAKITTVSSPHSHPHQSTRIHTT